jgi:hypothetical protein
MKHDRFIKMAVDEARKSPVWIQVCFPVQPRFWTGFSEPPFPLVQVGAVLTYGKTVLSVGHNVYSYGRGLGGGCVSPHLTVHAEVACLRDFQRRQTQSDLRLQRFEKEVSRSRYQPQDGAVRSGPSGLLLDILYLILVFLMLKIGM